MGYILPITNYTDQHYQYRRMKREVNQFHVDRTYRVIFHNIKHHHHLYNCNIYYIPQKHRKKELTMKKRKQNSPLIGNGERINIIV